MCVCACESVNAVLSVAVSPCLSLPISSLSPPHTPASATPVSFPVSVSSLALIVWLAARRECVRLKRPRWVRQLEKREDRQQAGVVKSFGVLTEAKGEEGRSATGEFGDN